jgi:nucleotide-binding universal stress UspA family protein
MSMKIARILAATDFSAAGNRAVAAAAALARREQAAMHIVHTAPPRRWLTDFWRRHDPLVDAAYSQASAALQRAAALCTPSDINVSTSLTTGVASRGVSQAATKFRADLLVIGARGERETSTHRPGLGGTATKLVARSLIPLLLVRPGFGDAPHRVLAGIDLSPGSAVLVDWARLFAAGTPFQAFHAYEIPFAERLEAYGLNRAAIDTYVSDEHARRDAELTTLLASRHAVNAQRIVERGDAGSLLFACIERMKASLVVLGKHAPRARRRPTTLGNVCRYVSAFTPASVLIVPPAGAAAARLAVG